MDGLARRALRPLPPPGAAARRRLPSGVAGVVAPHALMIAVMAATMTGDRPSIAVIGGAVLLVLASIGYAAVVRRSPHGAAAEHILDLWAMALVLVASVSSPIVHGHAAGVAPAQGGLAWFVVAGWALGRAVLVRRCPGRRVPACATACVSGAGLVLMCAMTH